MIPPCARSVLLSSGFVGARQQSDFAAPFGGVPGGRQACQAAADDEDVGSMSYQVVLHQSSGSISKLKSTAGAECVSAPTEIQSTPVFGELSHVRERDSAGGLECESFRRDRMLDRADRLPQAAPARRPGAPARVHVIEQDDIRAVFERVAQFVQIRHFDFHPRHAALGSLRGFERRRDATRQADVILLDQNGFPQILAVIAAAADANRIFFQRAQAPAWSFVYPEFARPCLRPRAQNGA